MKYTDRLENLVKNAVEKLQELVSLHGTESEQGNYKSLLIKDDDVMFNLERGTFEPILNHLTEVTEQGLIDDCGYSYGYYVLNTNQLLELVDHLVDEYNFKHFTKYINSTLKGEKILKLKVNSDEEIVIFTKNNVGVYCTNENDIDERSGDYLLCTVQNDPELNILK